MQGIVLINKVWVDRGVGGGGKTEGSCVLVEGGRSSKKTHGGVEGGIYTDQLGSW